MEKSKQLTETSRYLLIEQGSRIDRVFRKAVREALLKHKQAGNPVAVWQDGKVVILQPNDINPK